MRYRSTFATLLAWALLSAAAVDVHVGTEDLERQVVLLHRQLVVHVEGVTLDAALELLVAVIGQAHRHAVELGDLCTKLIGGLAVGDGHARAALRAELRDRDTGLREPDDDDLLSVELHVSAS